ncbi:MAG: phosphoribosylaminoimidazolesuccinocarboxamide synthase [bacterium]|nr:phosphoribosylaminoimidazolesuccinocarboxamide synthase [bacterium]
MPKKGSLLAEGKTKKIWRDAHTTSGVLIESKDEVTAGDGVRRKEFEGKGAYSTATTAKCFELLTAHGIPNHFLRGFDATTFCARKLRMIKKEVVVRRVATGSYLNRRPDVEEGTLFKPVVVEFFAKIDEEHDPLVIHDFVSERILLFHARKPLAEGYLREVAMADGRATEWFALREMVSLAEQTFAALEAAWATQDVMLVDLKIECGRDDTASGRIVVGDVITNDEWRIWPGGDKSRQLDKQVFRETPEATHEAMKALKANYAKVAEMVEKFPV